MNKSDVRALMKSVRANITERAKKDSAIARAVSEFARNYNSVFIYVSMNSEVETRTIISDLAASKRVFVPYTEHGVMHAVSADCVKALDKTDNLGNTVKATDYFDGQADLTVVPLLAFDKSLHRLGYGAGCYDKYFAEFGNCTKVGLAYGEQLCEFEYEPFDVPLDAVITPNGIIRRLT